MRMRKYTFYQAEEEYPPDLGFDTIRTPTDGGIEIGVHLILKYSD